MSLSGEVVAVARLDFGDVRRSRWLGFSAGVYALFTATFVFVGMRESGVVGFTGSGRVLLSLVHALILVLPLLALTATCQVVNKARDDGTLEVLFSHPLTRLGYLAGVTITRYAVLFVPLAIIIVLVSALGGLLGGDPVAWTFSLRAIAVSAGLLCAGVGVGLAVSVGTRDQARAIVTSLIVWAAGVALLDFALIGVLLQWHLNPRVVFILAALNPVQCARLALLSGVQPELASFGPVGFYLATHLGPRALLALGIAWPTTIGVGAWLIALRSFRSGDVV
ncbi:MAG: ABC transporter permease subunit [Deltaproteobacteria bacterium]